MKLLTLTILVICHFSFGGVKDQNLVSPDDSMAPVMLVKNRGQNIDLHLKRAFLHNSLQADYLNPDGPMAPISKAVGIPYIDSLLLELDQSDCQSHEQVADVIACVPGSTKSHKVTVVGRNSRNEVQTAALIARYVHVEINSVTKIEVTHSEVGLQVVAFLNFSDLSGKSITTIHLIKGGLTNDPQ